MTALHHRPHIEDIRSAYDDDRSRSISDGERSCRASHSGSSDKSSRTPPTIYSTSLAKPLPPRPLLSHSAESPANLRYFQDRDPQQSPQSSSESLASTVASQEEDDDEQIVDEAVQDDVSEYHVPQYTPRSFESSAIPATPSEFSDLFPSTRRLAVRHDDSTPDGNMNLRIDTEVHLPDNQRGLMTLFHLRMHDLRNREFSLRRYCRDSGREVCHSARKRPTWTKERRPSLQRSLSSALNSILPRGEQKMSASAGLKRHDSGYGSMYSMETDSDGRPRTADSPATSSQFSNNTVKLEFSNYAQVVVKRVGNGRSRRYEFEYWGAQYAWRRSVRKVGDLREVSYHLNCAGHDQTLAHIVPILLSPSEAVEEHMRGGWIAPCSMWIADKGIVRAQKDIADVIIASGLMALVDDSIKRHFHTQDSRQLLIPVPKLQIGVEYVGPKRLLSEIFRRGDSAGRHSRQSSLAYSRPTSSGPGLMEKRTAPRAIRQRSCEY